MSQTGKKRSAQKAPRFIAKIKKFASDSAAAKVQMTGKDKQILQRIQSCLARAHHPNTPESEAQTALRMSSRLMTKFNVNHAEADRDEGDTVTKTGPSGHSTVGIFSPQAHKSVVEEGWADKLAEAMEIFFDCDSFSTRRFATLEPICSEIERTFYGIALNTEAAARSFEMVYNLVWDWSRGRGRTKVSYQHGIADGLIALARAEKAEEVENAKKREEMGKQVKPQQQLRSDQTEQLDHDAEVTSLSLIAWRNPQALLDFRQAAQAVAADYLKTMDIELGTAVRRRYKRDTNAYAEGMEDSKKIDIKRRRLGE